MKKGLLILTAAVLSVLTACTETSDEYNPYTNWEARNATWFRQITDSARQNVDDNWVRYRSLQKSQDASIKGTYTDSICVHIRQQGTGTECPLWTDSVKVSFRGWIMPATYRVYDYDKEVEVDSLRQQVFTQTYFGPFNPATASPLAMVTMDMIDGFSTALQYMHTGDIWDVYIPQQLAYKDKSQSEIPAYSTLLFRINLVDITHISK